MGSLVRICAISAAVLVAASFAFFAVDQMSEGSETQVNALANEKRRTASEAQINRPSPAPGVERLRETRHSGARELVDDANDVLTAPFNGLVDSTQIWVERGVPTLLALLLYGLGGTLLANTLPKPTNETRDWRQSTG